MAVSARNLLIAARFRAGETMLAIASDYGISKMRVCQILRAQRIRRTEGGASLRARLQKGKDLRAASF